MLTAILHMILQMHIVANGKDRCPVNPPWIRYWCDLNS